MSPLLYSQTAWLQYCQCKEYNAYIKENRKLVRMILNAGNKLLSTWIPAHMDVHGNGLADLKAKEAAESCKLTDTAKWDPKILQINLQQKRSDW